MKSYSISLNLTENKVNELKKILKIFKEIEPSAQYIKWEGWKDNVKIILYKTNKLVLQSKDKNKLDEIKYKIINELYKDEEDIIIGIDETGRSELKGNMVIVAAIGQEKELIELRDSKKTKDIEKAFNIAKNNVLGTIVFSISPKLIDLLRGKGYTLNEIENAFLKTITKLNEELKISRKIIVDGQPLTSEKCEAEFIPKADDKISIVSAASIIAKYLREILNQNLERKSWKNYKVKK